MEELLAGFAAVVAGLLLAIARAVVDDMKKQSVPRPSKPKDKRKTVPPVRRKFLHISDGGGGDGGGGGSD